MYRPEDIAFELTRYHDDPRRFTSALVAQLPGLLITQSSVYSNEHRPCGNDSVALRFDFIEDWYSVLAFLDANKQPTGHYRISIQTPLTSHDGVWCGCDLLLGIEVMPGHGYAVMGEEDFCEAVEDGWMRVYAAANAREAMRKLCRLLDEGRLPQEVMDAVCG